jgi:broad specificity phosphatase PhoE
MMLYLIRHSTTAQNPDVSSHAWVLSPEGRHRARQLARQLISQPAPKQIYTSIEPKAYETGEILAAELGLPLHTAESFHEQNRHSAPYFSTSAAYQAAIAQLFAHPDELVFGEETGAQACNRFSQAIRQISQRHPTENIAIVTHGTVLSLFVARHNPAIDGYEFWQELTMPDCYALSEAGFHLQRRITVEALETE